MSQNLCVIVTGAGGFVGRHIVDAIHQQGKRVVAVDRAFDDDLRNRWQQVGRIQVLETDAFRQLEPADMLIHAAAITTQPDDETYPAEKHLKDNLLPVLDLLEWGYSNRIQRMIFVSSDAVYSSSPVGAIDEDQSVKPLGTYAAAKAATEQIIETLRHAHGRDVLTVRLSGIYGTGEHVRPTRPRVSVVMEFVERALAEGRIAINPARPARSWTYASDIGSAVCALLNTPHLQHALYNVATEECLTEQQIALAIQHYLPDVEIVAAASDEPILRRGHISHARLQRETGFSDWTSFQEGIGRVIAWRREQHPIP